MKQSSKDPFEVAFEEQEEEAAEEGEEQSPPPDSPVAAAAAADGTETETQRIQTTESESAPLQLAVDDANINSTQEDDDEDYDDNPTVSAGPPTNTKPLKSRAAAAVASRTGKAKEEEDEEEDEDNMDVELGNPSTSDPDKMSKMQAILSQFTEEQMSRYESFRRSGFQKSNMKRLIASITGSAKISIPMTIVVSGIAKLFVGELVEAARIVMSERKESGPIRPCHMREAYRRLKLEGKVPKRSVRRLFR